MIRKEGKACWTYTCQPCDVSMTCVDQFRAIEYAQWHQRGGSHVSILLSDLMGKALESMAAALKPALDAAATLTDLLAAPTNRPHDPSLLRDRRKWGGR